MTYVEFFRERQQARYAVGKGRFRSCCEAVFRFDWTLGLCKCRPYRSA
jgi:hypothetical protein